MGAMKLAAERHRAFGERRRLAIGEQRDAFLIAARHAVGLDVEPEGKAVGGGLDEDEGVATGIGRNIMAFGPAPTCHEAVALSQPEHCPRDAVNWRADDRIMAHRLRAFHY